MKNIRKTLKKIEEHMSASQIMVAGFALLILFGTMILMLPLCNADHKVLNFVDALFTACSSVCVTGLVTIVPATQFTMIGKIVVLILIQAGGLGIIVCTMTAFLILRKQITIRDRVLIQQNFNLNTMSGLVSMLRYVLTGTFLVEGLGAIMYAFQFIPEYGLLKGAGYSVFHAVSTFCNAGIDILGDNSLQNYQMNPWINFVAIFLIIVSGLGFIVWQDMILTFQKILKKECSTGRALQKMRLQTKLALMITGILVIFGTVIIFCMEYNNPDTLGSLSFGQKWMSALFQSVTTRTAGFFTIPQNFFRDGTQLFCCVLMFIGGCPGGTAGGVKTTTIAVMLLSCQGVLSGNDDVECFHRTINRNTVRTAFSIITVSFITLVTGTIILNTIEPITLSQALYEVTSAVGTVGLTAGATPLLSTPGKLLIIIIMYLGRLSPVTMALLFAGKNSGKKNCRKLAEERVMVG